jgi:hypothetical protein
MGAVVLENVQKFSHRLDEQKRCDGVSPFQKREVTIISAAKVLPGAP